ncbi:S-layer homology domain-containing protein [Lysinibacillus telephonicus]|uniref:S-layer homology domain-containing protein n=1 Tax=Lysinibacillus telephonicus TaxID=1714840 RepID=A0A3S0JMG9_9BACI|nr:S-layer homology domain-containing protein [Lysinibacillus telephonicus]RTQ86346.1 S-layer homology domain-containing protein [Lysinibacillus telephonicus]
MANQPKKYKKFVATAATATLVASAIVPVASAAASFPDVAENNSHAEAINALVEAGIIKGYEDGTFKPNAQLTRGHVVKMLGKWVEAQGFEIPADYNTVQRFDDVAVDAADQELVKYAALVKDTGVFLGSDGDLNAADSITRENMALTLDRAYKAVFKKSLVELAEGSTNLTVSDLATAKEEAREEIQALRNLGISNVNTFNPKDTVTRAQFASFLHRTIEAEGTPSTEVGAIKSATATKVNEVTVVFDAPVADTEAAKFAFARGTTAINVTDVDWSEDKTTAVLTVDTKFVDATYNLTVTGVAEKELTASIKTTREEVSSIEFNSSTLVLTGTETATAKEARITFSVYNQYGEEITDDIPTSRYKDLKISGIDEESIEFPAGYKGVISVMVDEDEDDDAEGSISFTYENGEVEIDVDQDVVLSDEIEPGSVEIKGVYSPTDEELSTKNLIDGDEFYIIFSVKDQFGATIDPEYADKQNVASGDTTILEQVQDGLRVDVSNKDIFALVDEEDIEVKNVDGKWYFAIAIDSEEVDEDDIVGGENTVTFRAKATGEESSSVIKVTDSAEVYKIELSSPDEVVAGDEEVKVPVFAYDQNGESITDAAELNDDLRDGKIKIDWDADRVALGNAAASTVFTFIEEDGQLYLTFDSADNLGDEAEELDIDIEVDKSGEESSITLDIEPNAHPESLVKIADNSNTYIYKGATLELAYDDFVIEDQYGRVFDKFSDTDSYQKDSNGNIVRDSEGNPIPSWKNYTITGKSLNENNVSTSSDTSGLDLVGIDGNATVEFTLTSRDVEGNLVTDVLSTTIRTVEASDFDSYKVYSDELVYGKDDASPADNANIEVYGVLGNGVEVELPADGIAYKVLAGDYLTVTDTDEVDVKADITEIGTNLSDAGDRIETDVTVVINGDGSRIEHKITLAEATPKVASFELEDADSLNGNLLKSLDINVTSGDTVITATDIYAALLSQGSFDIEDQYGEDLDNDDFNSSTGEFTFFRGKQKLGLTISDINSANDDDVEVRSNGTVSTKIYVGGNNGVVEGDSFNLTLTINGKTQTVKVYVK